MKPGAKNPKSHNGLHSRRRGWTCPLWEVRGTSHFPERASPPLSVSCAGRPCARSDGGMKTPIRHPQSTGRFSLRLSTTFTLDAGALVARKSLRSPCEKPNGSGLLTVKSSAKQGSELLQTTPRLPNRRSDSPLKSRNSSFRET